MHFRQPSLRWRKAGTIHNREMFSSWLREVTFRTALRARERRTRSTSRLEIQDVEESHLGPEHSASRNELGLLVRAELNRLPAKYRSLVLHTYMEGKTNVQVARLLRCPVGTVKGRLSRVRDLLRARLSRRGWDCDEVRYQWGQFASSAVDGADDGPPCGGRRVDRTSLLLHRTGVLQFHGEICKSRQDGLDSIQF